LSKGLGKFWDLPGYISDCYRIYAEHRPEQLVNERVQGWLNDASNLEASARLRGGTGLSIGEGPKLGHISPICISRATPGRKPVGAA
jgi:hypothetical protein